MGCNDSPVRLLSPLQFARRVGASCGQVDDWLQSGSGLPFLYASTRSGARIWIRWPAALDWLRRQIASGAVRHRLPAVALLNQAHSV